MAQSDGGWRWRGSLDKCFIGRSVTEAAELFKPPADINIDLLCIGSGYTLTCSIARSAFQHLHNLPENVIVGRRVHCSCLSSWQCIIFTTLQVPFDRSGFDLFEFSGF
jgi:hypothetical protein